MIIENKIRNIIISARSFSFRRAVWTSRSEGYAHDGGPSTGGVSPNWFSDRNFLAMSIDVSEILNWLWGSMLWSVYWWHWWRISRSRCKQWHRQRRNNPSCSNRNLWREIWNELKERDIDRHKVLPGLEIIIQIFFLSSNKDTFDWSRRQFI